MCTSEKLQDSGERCFAGAASLSGRNLTQLKVYVKVNLQLTVSQSARLGSHDKMFVTV
jgi:hypothetical protein